ncbi:PAX3- and PAX7-binding protein 1 [Frankliniella fusca]|uniref:PAX3- and PAX7-binding protein 1 n=1 Tax=Frankliniella fusca TaxID=407009 RepID=A0AAE1H9G9_9NEOP|nr:PAX3- and PAX7-binding protein 1 [Frankliniella fusca]
MAYVVVVLVTVLVLVGISRVVEVVAFSAWKPAGPGRVQDGDGDEVVVGLAAPAPVPLAALTKQLGVEAGRAGAYQDGDGDEFIGTARRTDLVHPNRDGLNILFFSIEGDTLWGSG